MTFTCSDFADDIIKKLVGLGLIQPGAVPDDNPQEQAKIVCDAIDRLAASAKSAAVAAPPPENSVKVKHWDAYSDQEHGATHQIDILDQRASNGQAFLTVGALEGDVDDMLSATAEVNTNPLNGIDHVPCVYVHFDADNLAVSLFKLGPKILVRTENGVSINAFSGDVGGRPEKLYWIDKTP